MSERLNLAVDDGIGDMLSRLAGGERKRGSYLSDLVRGLAATQGRPDADPLTLEMAVKGMAGQLQTLAGRVAILENTVAVLVADRSGAPTWDASPF